MTDDHMEGFVGSMYGIPVALTINALTGKVDMTPEEIYELINAEVLSALDSHEEKIDGSLLYWESLKSLPNTGSPIALRVLGDMKKSIAELRTRYGGKE